MIQFRQVCGNLDKFDLCNLDKFQPIRTSLSQSGKVRVASMNQFRQV